MKTFIIAAIAALASLAVADVQTFSDTNCNNNYALTGTKAGFCYNLGGDRRSAKGCSVGHNLRVYSGANCNEEEPFNTVKPQKCVNQGGLVIGSIKCLN